MKNELTKNGDIKDPFVLQYCTKRILEYNELLNKKDIEHWTAKEVMDFLMSGNDDICFSDYARKVHIPRMIDNGQERNARNYTLALQHLERFMGTNKIMFSHLTSATMNKWIKSLESTHRAIFAVPSANYRRGGLTAGIQQKNENPNCLKFSFSKSGDANAGERWLRRREL